MNWFKNLFGAKKAPTEDALDLNREIQLLKLELEERDRSLTKLRNELQHTRSCEGKRLEQDVHLQVEKLLSDAAVPAAQLITQAHLIEVEGKDIPAKDVITVARRLVRSLESAGLAIKGKVGDIVTFDPNHHEPLSSNTSIASGDKVIIKLVGISYRDKTIRKAGVEQCRDV